MGEQRRFIHQIPAACIAGTLLWFVAAAARSEVYIGPQVGGAIPFSFRNVEGTGLASNTDTTPIPMSNSFLYGGKVGYFLPEMMDWLGLEVDVTHKNPDLQQHTFTITQPNGTSTTLTEGLRVSMTTLALRPVIRTPDIEGWGGFQPYAGLGPAFFFVKTTGASSSSDTSVGFSFQAGTRYFLSRQVVLFAEYKLDAAMLKFSDALAPGAGFKGDYTTNTIAVGVLFHFPQF